METEETALTDTAVLPTETAISYQDSMAELTRNQWEDFQTRYIPVQDNLLDLANSNQLLTEQLGRNKTNVDNSFALAESNEAMRMGRYGLPTENSATSKNNTGLLKSLTTASTNNETREAVDDLQTKIVTGQGGSPSSLADIGANG